MTSPVYSQKGKKLATIKRRGNKLSVRFFLPDGSEKTKSTGLDDTAKNRKLIKQQIIPEIERRIALGEYGKSETKTLEHYVNRYLQLKEPLKSYHKVYQATTYFSEFFHLKVNQIKVSDIREWIAKIREGRTPKTVRNYASIFRGVLQLALEDEALEKNPFIHIRFEAPKKIEINPFTPEEVERLLYLADGQFKLYLAICFYTGMRSGEVLGLMWSDIDWDKNQIKVRRTIDRGIIDTPKTAHSVRNVPLFEVLKPYFKTVPQNSLYLFHKNGRPFFGPKVFSQNHWVKLLKLANIPHRRMYETRHTFATTMLSKGILKPYDLSKILGHANTQMVFETYVRYVEGVEVKLDQSVDLYSQGTNLGTVAYKVP